MPDQFDRRIVKITTEEQYNILMDEAFEHGYELLNPSHLVYSDGELVGAFGVMPMALIWMHPKKARKLDTFFMMASLDALIRQGEDKEYCINCEKSSPFFPLLEKNMDKMYSMQGEEDWKLYLRG